MPWVLALYLRFHYEVVQDTAMTKIAAALVYDDDW